MATVVATTGITAVITSISLLFFCDDLTTIDWASYSSSLSMGGNQFKRNLMLLRHLFYGMSMVYANGAKQ